MVVVAVEVVVLAVVVLVVVAVEVVVMVVVAVEVVVMVIVAVEVAVLVVVAVEVDKACLRTCSQFTPCTITLTDWSTSMLKHTTCSIDEYFTFITSN
jgi:hypothetical protein